jgi:hypothetical protein
MSLNPILTSEPPPPPTPSLAQLRGERAVPAESLAHKPHQINDLQQSSLKTAHNSHVKPYAIATFT